MSKATIFPLYWPVGVARSVGTVKSTNRLRQAAAHSAVLKALDALSVVTGKPISETVLSSNAGNGDARIADAGVATWFGWCETQRCISFDLYDTPAANFHAVEQIIQACIAEMGRGGMPAVKQALSSFTQQPPPASEPERVEYPDWSAVLGIAADASPTEIQTAFRQRARAAHPDAGGDRTEWDLLVAAKEKARRSADQSLAGLADLSASEASEAFAFYMDPDPLWTDPGEEQRETP